jgi:hypothetical protein
VPSGKIPVVPKLALMLLGPVSNESRRSRRQLSSDYGQGLDVDRRFVIRVPRMEVRSAEVVDLVVVHPDQDPVERTDSRHWSMMPRASVDPRQHRAGSALLVDQGDCDGSGMDI